MDLVIAATANIADATVVTENTDDFAIISDLVNVQSPHQTGTP
ncbi:MAG: type II toxin-antitoxin system VapC family toxin [Solirubrobacteraceae bacterium]